MNHEYEAGETGMTGFLARPEGSGLRPAILVFHEAPGLGDHPRRRAAMLSELGYIALAADMYGDGRTYFGPDALTAMDALRRDVDLLRSRAAAALEALAAVDGVDTDRIAAIGYCFGGMCALELARSGADLRAAISFHGLLRTDRPAGKDAVKAAILAMTGSADPLAPPEDVQGFEREMTQAQADWQLVTFGGARHAFTNRDAGKAGNPALAYDPSADRRAWAYMQAFLAETLEPVR